MSGEWRYVAQRLSGAGRANDTFLDVDLPLSGVEIEDVLTGINALSGTISPEIMRLRGPDGESLIQEWGTAIFAECDGDIRGGGIVSSVSPNGPSLGIECVGYTGYLTDLPYVDSTFFVETDPMDIFRHVWDNVQSKRGGNLGFEIGGTKSPITVGTELEQVEFDTQSGPLSFESGPYKLAWYQTHDLSENASELATNTPFDWRERHYWAGEEIRHVLELGYPTLGRRRDDLRFALGENVFVAPDITVNGEEYADEMLVLGAGEGRKMKRGSARRNVNRLRRVGVVSDPALRSESSCNKRAEKELAWRQALETVTSLEVFDHPSAPVGSVEVGDEIFLSIEDGWGEVDAWFRVLAKTIKPEEAGAMTLSVDRTDRIAA